VAELAVRGRQSGAERFERYYAELFGSRWRVLRELMLGPARQVLRLNAFAQPAARTLEAKRFDATSELSGCLALPPGLEAWRPALDEFGIRSGYAMDAASVVAARALEVEAGHRVLDLCAAPGGKSLVLLEALEKGGHLTANDRSRKRAERLRLVMKQHVPRSVQENVRLTTHDAKRWGLVEPLAYDRILLDAPCSSERHVLTSPAELAKWSPSRVRRLAVEQHALLASAARALKVGGQLVYCTCALTPAENDAVVARALRKDRHGLSSCSVSAAIGEPTELGWQIHPDRHTYGPIYFARLVKVSLSKADRTHEREAGDSAGPRW
jgi:16S rRNA C967 or C1407 C5-methylase (RsmB/RsmF family)